MLINTISDEVIWDQHRLTNVLPGVSRRTHTETQAGRSLCDNTARLLSDGARNQGMPRIANYDHMLGRGRKGLIPRVFSGIMPS